MKIRDYVQKPEGWAELGKSNNLLSYIRQRDGIQLYASFEDWHGKHVLWVSLGLHRGVNCISNHDEREAYLLKQTPSVLTAFFGQERSFQRQPPHDASKEVHHYTSPLPDCAGR